MTVKIEREDKSARELRQLACRVKDGRAPASVNPYRDLESD